MKKLLLLASVLLAFSLVSCAGAGGENTDSSGNKSSQPTQQNTPVVGDLILKDGSYNTCCKCYS